MHPGKSQSISDWKAGPSGAAGHIHMCCSDRDVEEQAKTGDVHVNVSEAPSTNVDERGQRLVQSLA